METTFKKITIGVLVVAVLALAAMFFLQRKDIGQIEDRVSAIEAKNVDSAVVANPPEDFESIKSFNGEVRATANNVLDIEAVLYVPKDIEKEKANQKKLEAGQPVSVSSDDYDKISKVVKVSLIDGTEYYQVNKEDFKVGDKVFVIADKSPFKTTVLTAVKIGYSLEK